MELTELVAPPTEGRVFTDRARAGLGDVAPSGRVRLDTIARWLQDAAFADLLDSGVPDDGVWIVRRLRLRVERFPRMHEHVSVATWCSGAGSLVAERRSTVRGDDGGLVEAVALWVHLDPVGARPRPMPEGFEAVYAPSAAGRRVRARLRHRGEPPTDGDVALRGASAPPTSTSPTTSTTPSTGRRSRRTSPATAPASRSTRRSSTAPRPTSARPRIVRDGEMLWIAAADGEVLASLATPGGPTVRAEISTSA